MIPKILENIYILKCLQITWYLAQTPNFMFPVILFKKLKLLLGGFKLLEKDKQLRVEILNKLIAPSNKVINELKKVNIFYGTRKRIINGIEVDEPFIAFSCTSPKLMNKLAHDEITQIDGKLIISRPPNNNSPDRFVKAPLENRAFDAEVSMFDDWMKRIYLDTGLDWRILTDRPQIKSMLGTNNDFNSTMTPCPSCTNVFDTFFGNGVLGPDSNLSEFVKSGLKSDD